MFRQANKRPLKFAGSWYEADPKRLAGQLDGFDSSAQKKVVPLVSELADCEIMAVVAPHAGYTFSGPTAACSYMAAAKKKVKRVFLLGPSHYKAFRGAAISSDKSFATVFGDLPVDCDVVADLKNSRLFHELSDVHRDEHSLEMQLAFIKRDFGNVKIVPILIGRLEDAFEARQIAACIRSYLREGDLIAVSSDFTHYGPRYGYTPFMTGGDFAESVKKLDLEAFSHLQANDLDGFFAFYRRTEDTICGIYALAVMLALLPEDARGHLIDYRTSRDSIVEDDRNSVSYLSIAFASKKGWTVDEGLTDEEKQTLLKIARASLDSFVRSGRAADFSRPESGIRIDDRLKRPQGVFVTLFRHRPGQKKELRGCIGYIMPVKPLFQAVVDNAQSACSRDHRFEPVRPDELAEIEIEISVLTTPKEISSYKDIRLGQDGILFFCQGKQSVFLPHVATEFGWTLEETLSQLAAKAGAPRMAWKGPTARFEVFQAISIEEGHKP
ncbi:MAG: AmmeMemoRadiSam system protein B [Cyanobacteria bacterium SZAS LIN-2]|nr:AmmeMemoRadiSam system protein B [Cyanobacteria bacterium SZAS LIN-2]